MKQKYLLWGAGALVAVALLWFLFRQQSGSGDAGQAGRFTTSLTMLPPPDDSARLSALSDLAGYAFGAQRDETLGLIQRDIDAKREDISLASTAIWARTQRQIAREQGRTDRMYAGADLFSTVIGGITSLGGLFGL